MRYEFNYSQEADGALDRLERDPALARAQQAVDRLLLRMEEDPFDPKLGTTGFVFEDYGGVNATPARYDDWYVFWQRGPQPMELDIILVHQRPI
jgi:hypothetical protein